MRDRPCACDRHVPGEPFARGRDCARCWLWHNSPKYRAGPPGVNPTPPPAPCGHRGPELSGPERQAAGVGHARVWYRCELGLSVGGSPPGVVCRCKGCGPRCPGYQAGEAAD